MDPVSDTEGGDKLQFRKEHTFKIFAYINFRTQKQYLCCFKESKHLKVFHQVAAAAKSLQSCPTLCNPIDGSALGSAVPGILQARILDGLPFPSPMHESEKWKWSRSVVPDSATPWTATYQAPPSMGFLTRDHHNKYNNNERVWNIVRITKMWHRDMK